MKGELEGRVAIVTGATSGIGEGTAHLLASRGAKVAAVGRNAAKLEELRGAGMFPVEASLTDPGSYDVIVAEARKLGPVTILVNCAGHAGHVDSPIFDQSTEHWRQSLTVNLDAPYELTRRVAHDIRAANWGRVVMVSSTAGEKGAPAMSAYCAGKHGVIGLMRSVAWDLGPYNATCNAVLPGWVRTAMAEGSSEQDAARRGVSVETIWAEYAASYPPGRVVTVAEVANAIGFLVSEQASGINGEAMTVALGGLW